MAAVHDRYLGVIPSHRRSLREYFHVSQCTSLFMDWLSQPITEEHKDPIWTSAGSLSILTFSSTSATQLEDAWPLSTPDSSDLEWLRLGAGKMKLWHMVDPLRESSVFHPMFKLLGGLREAFPLQGTDNLLSELAEVCGLDEHSTSNNNPYFTVAHALSWLLKLPSDQSSLGRILMVSSHMHAEFEVLLHKRDPVALFLLCLWYAKARWCKWWIDFRARHEVPAICKYIQDRYGDHGAMHALLHKYGVSPVLRQHHLV